MPLIVEGEFTWQDAVNTLLEIIWAMDAHSARMKVGNPAWELKRERAVQALKLVEARALAERPLSLTTPKTGLANRADDGAGPFLPAQRAP